EAGIGAIEAHVQEDPSAPESRGRVDVAGIELLGAVAADELPGEDVKLADVRQSFARIGDIVFDLPELDRSASREWNGCYRRCPGLQLRGLAGGSRGDTWHGSGLLAVSRVRLGAGICAQSPREKHGECDRPDSGQRHDAGQVEQLLPPARGLIRLIIA